MLSLLEISPAPGEGLVALDSPIEFTLADDGTGIDISTLIVEIKGFRAISGIDFGDGFNGLLSSITPSGSDYIIIIDPESNFNAGKTYDVKVQVQDLDGSYFNKTYSFKTIPEKPILVSSSPSNGSIVDGSQVIYLEFDDILDGVDKDTLNVSINSLSYITNGYIEPNINGTLSSIIQDGTSISARVDPSEILRNGPYTVSYEVSDTNGNKLIGFFKFTINREPDENLPDVFPNAKFLGFFQGIERASDLGCGDSIYLEWNKPLKNNYKNEAFVLVYKNSYRLSVFDSPSYIALPDTFSATLSGLVAGETLSFGARSFETASGIFNLNGMTQVDDGFYQIPSQTNITSIISLTDTEVSVSSVEGYPDAGLIRVGNEVIKYSSINRTNNIFNVASNGRGAVGSTASVHFPDDSLQLFLGCTDDNTVIVMSTPTYQDGYESGRVINNTGLVITDYSDNDRVFHEGFDFCGWHDPRPEEVLTGNDACGSYQGGEFNGWRGLNLYDRMLNREEVLLGVTGEPVILLKRIWDGSICSCMNGRKGGDPKLKSCQSCYGTGYEGGFLQFDNLRRVDKRVLLSFNETAEDLKYGEKENLQQEYEPSAWTLPQPAIRDRDLILRFDYTNDREYIYEVLNVSKEKMFARRFGRQRLTLKRLDKTDIVYTIPIDLSNIT